MKNVVLSVIALCGSAILAPAAEATTYEYLNTGLGGNQQGAGTLNSLHLRFDDVTNLFTFEATIKDSGTGLANGFAVAVNNGPNPKGTDELALFYFDASKASPTLTAHVYNGKNDFSSYQTGVPLIKSSDKPNGTNNIFVQTAGNTRTFGFTVDARVLNEHPAVAGLANFRGVGFDQHMGIWLHWFTGLNTTYGENGGLASFAYRGQGWFDGENLNSNVPEPSSLLLMSSALFGLRRRKKQA